MRKEWAFLKLLTTKGYKKVVLIPLAFCLGLFLYYLYIDFTGSEVDKTVFDAYLLLKLFCLAKYSNII